MNAREKRTVRQAVLYLIAGGAFFWSGYVAFFIFDKGLGFTLFWAKIFSSLIGLTVNFLLERYWVFARNRKRDISEATFRYILITVLNLFIDYGIIRGLKSFGITPYIGQFLSAGFFTVWNYLWYRFWVFRPRRGKA